MAAEARHRGRGRRAPLKGGARLALLAGLTLTGSVLAAPYLPRSDTEVLATVPPGAAHASGATRAEASARLDVALPLAQFYISQARGSGDLRFLGYADAALEPWRKHDPPLPAVLVLEATILQSRHAFPAALTMLTSALALRPDDAQAWLTRATIERVLGEYVQAQTSCARITAADPVVAQICSAGVLGLSGQLTVAEAQLRAAPEDGLPPEAQAWHWSELGDVEVRRGEATQAERAYRNALQRFPADSYSRTAYADLLLEQNRPREVLSLLAGDESIEPMLLRIALAEQQLRDPQLTSSRALLADAFDVEERRGEAVHRREQARYLLDIEHDARAALRAALEDWQVQREPADLLILLRAAGAAGEPRAAAPARDFIALHGTEDARLALYLEAPQ